MEATTFNGCYVPKVDTTKEDFEKAIGCKTEKFAEATIYVVKEGVGPWLANTLKRCGLNVRFMSKGPGGVIYFQDYEA